MQDLVTPRRPYRPVLGHTVLNGIVALYVLATLNVVFWRHMAQVFANNPLQGALFAVSIFALTMLTLELLGPGRLQKPVAATLILIAAAANHYGQALGIVIDREMVRNVLETTVTESRHLMTASAIGSITLTGVLPAALVFWPRVKRVGRWHQAWRWPLGVASCFALVAGGLFADFKTFSAILRDRQELMASYQPGATLGALVKYYRQQWAATAATIQPVATDATRGPSLKATEKPVLLVLFAGETTRAQNFGLNGYSRQTTPGLAARDVINFSDVTACGTSTAVSLPCMFSPLSQADYSRDAFLSHENLLDVLARAGFAVRWVDNNTGDQHIAARTGWDRVDAALDPAACAIECTDAVFLPLIRQTLDSIAGDTVLVLHMIGNHGPAYFLRYPRDRATFVPECLTAEFSECSVEAITNAYDNAILETDRLLSQAIDMLSASDKALTAMLYVSDHGESLGEGGLFLHAAPRFMAPETQTKVPMVMWLDPDFRAAMGIDETCLRDAAGRPASHDNLFHSVLGLLDVASTTLDPALDLTRGCRTARTG